jgi:hypothetical protein
LLAAFVMLALTPAISTASAVKSGVHGSVTRGPTQPVCQPKSPCTTPAAGIHLTFVRGSVVRHTRTNRRGRYSIRLAPGRYTVRVAAAGASYSPRKVTVRARRMSVLNIDIDTGIR